MPRNRTRKLNRPAAGTPANSKPMPANSACRIAMPMMPRETLRIVAPAKSTNSSPRPAARRPRTFLVEWISDGPGIKRKPEITSARVNLSRVRPTLPAALQGSAQGLEKRDRFDDEALKVGRREMPRLKDFFANERPGSYRFGRRRNCQTPVAKASK